MLRIIIFTTIIFSVSSHSDDGSLAEINQRIESEISVSEKKDAHPRMDPHAYVQQGKTVVPNLEKDVEFLCYQPRMRYLEMSYSMLCYTSSNFPGKVKVEGKIVHDKSTWTYSIFLNQTNFTNELLSLIAQLVDIPKQDFAK